jgi:hypothetical protein
VGASFQRPEAYAAKPSGKKSFFRARCETVREKCFGRPQNTCGGNRMGYVESAPENGRSVFSCLKRRASADPEKSYRVPDPPISFTEGAPSFCLIAPGDWP